MLKRDLFLFKRGLIPALILSIILSLTFILAGYSTLQGAVRHGSPVRVALVDKEGSAASRFTINIVSGLSYFSTLMNVEQTGEDDAKAGLRDGSYSAVIILPDGYTKAISNGDEGHGEIILSRGAAASAQIVELVADFGERLLAAGQYGVFAGINVISSHDLSSDVRKDFLRRSNVELLSTAAGIFDSGTIDIMASYAGTGLTTEAYFSSAWFCLFILISGLFFKGLYSTDMRRSVLTRLFCHGIRTKDYLIGKILFPLAFCTILAAAILFGLSRFIDISLSAAGIILAFFGILISTLIISLFSVALAPKKGSTGLILGIASICLLLCGGLIPRSLLPEWIATVGDFSPLGVICVCFRPLFGGKSDTLSLLPYILAGTAYAVSGLMLARMNIRKALMKGED